MQFSWAVAPVPISWVLIGVFLEIEQRLGSFREQQAVQSYQQKAIPQKLETCPPTWSLRPSNFLDCVAIEEDTQRD